MKTKFLSVAILLAALAASAHAQIFVANENGTVGEYNLDGTPINASLITGLSGPQSITISGNDMFIGESNGATGWIGEYNLDGTVVNASLISNQAGDAVGPIAVTGNDLIFANNSWVGGMTVSECTTSGESLNASFIPYLGNGNGYAGAIAVCGANMFITVGGNGNNEVDEYSTAGVFENTVLTGVGTNGIALSGSNLFVSDYNDGILGEYTTSGGTVISNINASTGNAFDFPDALAISGSDLFVADWGNQTVGEYGLDGTVVNSNLIDDPNVIAGIAVVAPVPEPSTWAMIAAGVGGLFAFRSRRRS